MKIRGILDLCISILEFKYTYRYIDSYSDEIYVFLY